MASPLPRHRTLAAERALGSDAQSLGGGTENIYYDGLGQRVGKAPWSGSSTTYVYDAFGQLAAEYNGSSWSRDYIRLGGGPLIASENASATICTTCYFSYDHLGSVRLVTDQNGNVVARHDYLPFGEEISAGIDGRSSQFGQTADVAQKFTGQIRDSESGVDYFNARYLTPVLGRFDSPDPMNVGANFLNSQSWNGYGYVLGNPLNAVDPSGLDRMDCGNGVKADACVSETSAPVDTYAWWMNWGWAYPCPTCNYYATGTTSGGGTTPTSPNPPAKAPPPKNGFGIRIPGKTFWACMSQNSNLYSMGGLLDLSYSLSTGKDSSLSSNPFASFFLGNSVNTFSSAVEVRTR